MTQVNRLVRTAIAVTAVVGVSAGVASGCTDDTPSADTLADLAPAPTTAAPATTSAPVPAPTTPSTEAAPSTSEVDPAAVLAGAFDEIAAGYHFTTEASIAGTPAVEAVGDRVGDTTRLSVSSNGSTVDYIVAPTGAWASLDADWQELDQPPITDPVAPLRSPESIAVESQDGTVVTLVATYPPAALSLTGAEPVTVRFVIEGTALQTISYAAETATGEAAVVATITPLTDSTPVTLPTT